MNKLDCEVIIDSADICDPPCDKLLSVRHSARMRIIQTLWSLFFISLAGLPCVLAPGPSRKNELNLSKVAAEPIVFWPIQTSKHNLPTTKRLAYLHDVLLTSGPTMNTGTLDALEFLEGSEAFAYIPNNGTMNGDRAMCWMFFVYIPNISWSQSSVLLSYEGTDGFPGFQLGVSSSGTLMADFYDMDGNRFALQSSISLEPSKWQFIGINFNMLWKDNQFDFFLIDHELSTPAVTTDTHSLGSTETLRLNAHGSIILGANHVEQNHFVGKMACIQFYSTSLIGGTQKEAVELCDPNVWTNTDYGEYTVDVSADTTTQQTTTTTTTRRTTTTRQSTTTALRTTTTRPKTTFTTTSFPTTISTRQPNSSQQQTTASLNPTGCTTNDICRCVDIELNEKELADKIESLKEKLLVNKEMTAMMIRTKTCAGDDRTSARVIGQCGLAVLIIVAAFLVSKDVVNVLRTVFCLFR